LSILWLAIAGMLQVRSNSGAHIIGRHVAGDDASPQQHQGTDGRLEREGDGTQPRRREGDTLVPWPVRHAGAKMP